MYNFVILCALNQIVWRTTTTK